MADLLGWVGAAGGIVGGGAGVVFGVLGLRAARIANKTAKNSSDLAERGEQIGLEANELAGEANRVAVDARELAEEANAIATRSERRETEVHDVRWEGAWEQPGRYVLTNVGEDEARLVRGRVTVDGEHADARADSVPAGGRLLFDLPGALEQFMREQDELAAWEQRVARNRSALVPEMRPYPALTDILEHVVWHTALAQERTHDRKSPISDLGGE